MGKHLKLKRKIGGKTYDIDVFHPTAFEKGVHTVRFHEYGQKYLDKFSKSTMVNAKGLRSAFKKGKKELFRI